MKTIRKLRQHAIFFAAATVVAVAIVGAALFDILAPKDYE